MKLDYLREFVVLSEELNFSSAASRLFISQSALSRHISNLEAEIGGKLLTRSTHHVELTPLGVRTAQQFRDILSRYDKLFTGDGESVQHVSGELCVGLLYYGIAEYYSDFLERFRDKYPDIHIQLSYYNPSELYRALMQGKLDVGDMICARALLGSDLVFHKLYTIRMIALMPESHPLAKKEGIYLREAASETLVDLEEDSVSSICTQEIIRSCGVVFRNTVYSRHVETVPSTVLACNGIHITGERVRGQAYPGIKYVPLLDEQAYAYHCFAHRADNQNALIPIFINEALHFFKKNAGA